MNKAKILETVADIAYTAGYHQYYSGNSRADISEYIQWANEFEKIHQETDWDKIDYILSVEKYTEAKINLS